MGDVRSESEKDACDNENADKVKESESLLDSEKRKRFDMDDTSAASSQLQQKDSAELSHEEKIMLKEKESLATSDKGAQMAELETVVSASPEKEMDGAPADRFGLVFIILLIHGISVLMPWNMFITANDYFVYYKLGNGTSRHAQEHSVYQKYFMNALTFVAQVPNVVLNCVNLLSGATGGNTSNRIVWSIISIAVMFIFTILLALIDSSGWPAGFFWITMILVVIINSANGMYQNSVYGLAACLPMKYTNAVIVGSNISGALTSIIALIAVAGTPDVRASAVYYFLTAVFVLLVAFDTFYLLPAVPFYKWHASRAASSTPANTDESASITKQSTNLKQYWSVFKQCWKEDLQVFFVFFVTLSCFPAIQVGVEPSDKQFISETFVQKYYTVVTCFVCFNVFAVIGSTISSFVTLPGPRYVWIPIALRVLFIPFFMFCNYKPLDRMLPVLITNDYVYVFGGILMALSSGYLSSLAMMFAPRNVAPEQKGTAGMMAALALILGIFFGIIFSFPWIAIIENVGYGPVNATTSANNVMAPAGENIFNVSASATL